MKLIALTLAIAAYADLAPAQTFSYPPGYSVTISPTASNLVAKGFGTANTGERFMFEVANCHTTSGVMEIYRPTKTADDKYIAEFVTKLTWHAHLGREFDRIALAICSQAFGKAL